MGLLQGWELGTWVGFVLHSSLAADSGVTVRGRSSSRDSQMDLPWSHHVPGELKASLVSRVILGCSQEGLGGIP